MKHAARLRLAQLHNASDLSILDLRVFVVGAVTDAEHRRTTAAEHRNGERRTVVQSDSFTALAERHVVVRAGLS